MNAYRTYFASLVIITSMACNQDDPIIVPDPPLPGRVDFQNPAVGQENRYLRLVGECGQVVPTTDTLFLRIVDILGDSLHFEEGFTAGSPSHYPIPFSYGARWSPTQIEIAADVRAQSSLLYFYGSDFLLLQKDHDRKMRQEQCLVRDGGDFFSGDAIGRVSRFEIGQQEYRQKKVVSCVPVIFDLDGYLLFDEHHLFSSFTSSLTSCCGQPEPDEPIIQAFALIK